MPIKIKIPSTLRRYAVSVKQIPGSSTSRFIFVIAVSLLSSACSPMTFTRTVMDWQPYDHNEMSQRKSGVVAQLKWITPGSLPSDFYFRVQACNRYGQLLVDQLGHPVFENVSPASNQQMWEKIALTNNTRHVIRLNQVVIRLFDPNGNQIRPLTRNDVASAFLQRRPCSSSNIALDEFRRINIFNRNLEVVPGTTSTFWVAFPTVAANLPGVWKFALYEVPVRVDATGRATKTTQFDIRMVAKEVVETYRAANIFAPSVLVSAKTKAP